MVVPFIGTQAWIRSLNFSTVDEWRPWFVDGQVAGWVHVLFIHQLTNNRPTNTVTLFRQAIYADLQGHTQTTSPLQPSRWEGAARSISKSQLSIQWESFFFLLVLLCDVYVMVCVGWWAYCSGVHAKAMLCYVCEVGFWWPPLMAYIAAPSSSDALHYYKRNVLVRGSGEGKAVVEGHPDIYMQVILKSCQFQTNDL